MGYWRKRGLRIIVYLDDGLCAVSGQENALKSSVLVHSTLKKSGFVANVRKSICEPTQHLQWLGFILDMSKGHIETPIQWLSVAKSKLEALCQLKRTPARQIASIVGTIISM